MRAGLIDRAPAPALAAGANALGLYYRLNRYTPRMRALISQWQTLERMPLAQIRTRQLDRLRHILRAAARTPFYAERFRAAGLAPGDITALDDLNALPVLTRQDIRDHAADMTVPGVREPVIARKSSGTTGEPISFLQSRSLAFDHAYAALYQFYGWHGIRPLARRASLAGRYMGKHPGGVVLRNWSENQLLLGVHALTAQTAPRYMAALRHFRPQILQAHPSAMLMLHELAAAQGLESVHIPAIAFTGETLLEDERAALMDWFGGVVFGQYGSGEHHVSAGECEALAGYHIHPEFSVTELASTPAGRQVVSTSLLNDVMPLIRYQIGDLAEGIDETPCACGRTWPRLTGLQGRADDVLTTASGRAVAPVVLRTGMAAHFSALPPWTIIQHQTPGRYTLRLFTGDAAGTFSPVGAYLADLLGPGAQIDVEPVAPQDRFSGRAKHKMVVRE